MDEYERRVLTILFSTNKTLYEAQTSNKYRLDNITELNESAQQRITDISIEPLELPLQKIRNEIYTRLLFAREYIDFLSNIPYINLYDCAEIIVEIGDIGRFSNRRKFISYAGLSPVELKKNNKVYKITKHSKGKRVANKKYDNIDYCENLKVALTRCTQKIINNDDNYRQYYEKKYKEYHFKHVKYSKKQLHLMALKKTTVRFANEIYSEFKTIKDIEDYEKMKYDGE